MTKGGKAPSIRQELVKSLKTVIKEYVSLYDSEHGYSGAPDPRQFEFVLEAQDVVARAEGMRLTTRDRRVGR